MAFFFGRKVNDFAKIGNHRAFKIRKNGTRSIKIVLYYFPCLDIDFSVAIVADVNKILKNHKFGGVI